MKALRYHGKEDVRIEDIEEPRVSSGTVRIKPAFTGICGSDLHLFYDGPMEGIQGVSAPHPISGETLPVVFGHEFSGTVEEIGEGVEGLSLGDRVVVEPFMVCEECAMCTSGRYNLCPKMGFIGISGRGGGLAEYIVVEERWVHPVGDMPLDQAALIEPLAVATQGVELSGAKEGDVAIVGGAGPIGLLTAAVLKAYGATVVITELSAARKDKARETGVADYVVDPREQDPVELARELTDGVGANVAFECTSVPAVFDQLLSALRPGGLLQVVALHPSGVSIDLGQVVMTEKIVQGTIGYANVHEKAIELVNSGRLDLSPFISGKIPVERIVEDGYTVLRERPEEAVKILVTV
ncbi:MAG TPA: 2,3-butanediol dehydrogenase [Candidatus Agrococcus pullicola]|uniref:2,3-butanediol dehydrogenase n=1 Tax=Candidatus Agrococcus pullicola TaxID=2838429 RepID=A0A9D2C9Q9_9MICO|nr:2,3-butanediol dehydrogenase [Candidatus Agrococcus pullicola]